MKTDCNVIKDLLPLYIDNCCSIESKHLVDEHIEECARCRDSYEHMKITIINEVEDKSFNPDKHEKVVIKKGVRKIRRLWFISLIAVILLVVPVLLNVKNEIKGEGRCLSNFKDIQMTSQFLDAIKNENYEEAFSYLNIETVYSNHNYPVKIEEYQEAAKEFFISDMQLLSKNGYRISGYKFVMAYRYETEWCLYFNIYMEDENGKDVNIGQLEFTASENGIYSSTCLSNDRGIYVWEAIQDWTYEAYDEFFDDNQFETSKANEVWR